MKKQRVKQDFLEQLAKIPIISTACDKVNISRQTVYRWRDEDPEFAKLLAIAQSQGDDFVNDVAENQLLLKIKNGEWPAIKYQLDKRHQKYRAGISTTTQVAKDGGIDIASLAKLAESNIRTLLESGDIGITKWYLERVAPDKYLKPSGVDRRQELAQKKYIDDFEHLLNTTTIDVKPKTLKIFEEDERKKKEELDKLKDSTGQQKPKPD